MDRHALETGKSTDGTVADDRNSSADFYGRLTGLSAARLDECAFESRHLTVVSRRT